MVWNKCATLQFQKIDKCSLVLQKIPNIVLCFFWTLDMVKSNLIFT
jgi:hypothetical protein